MVVTAKSGQWGWPRGQCCFTPLNRYRASPVFGTPAPGTALENVTVMEKAVQHRGDSGAVEIGILFLILRSFDLLHSSRVYAVLHIRTTSWSSNQPTRDIWLATLSASFVYTITARLR